MFQPNLLDPDRIKILAEQSLTRMVTRTSAFILMIVTITVIGLGQIKMILVKKTMLLTTEINQTRVVTSAGKTLPVSETTKRINQRLITLKPILSQ